MKMANIDAAFDWMFTNPRFADGVSHAVERKHYNGSLTARRFVLPKVLSIFERYVSRDTPYFTYMYIVHVSIFNTFVEILHCIVS